MGKAEAASKAYKYKLRNWKSLEEHRYCRQRYTRHGTVEPALPAMKLLTPYRHILHAITLQDLSLSPTLAIS